MALPLGTQKKKNPLVIKMSSLPLSVKKIGEDMFFRSSLSNNYPGFGAPTTKIT